MKKMLLGMAGLLMAFSVVNVKAEKLAEISIIGGADGPTAVFFAGKLGNDEAENHIEEDGTEEEAEILYEMKTKYVGNASAVGALITELADQGYIPAEKFTFEIRSEKEPYGLTVKLAEELTEDDSSERKLVDCGHLLLALIENLSEVEFSWPLEGEDAPFHMYINQVTAKQSLDGNDVKEFGKTPEKIADLMEYPVEPNFIQEKNAAVFEDSGDEVNISVWDSGRLFRKSYRLEDGTELLWKNEVGGLEDFGESFARLSAETQERILKFYEERKELYDMDEFLKKAWEDYIQCRNEGTDFQTHLIQKEVYPGAETEKIIAYLTSLLYPADSHYDGTAEESYSNMIFDKDTGDIMDVWTLFQVPEEDAREQLMERCRNMDEMLSCEEIKRALTPENIIWNQGELEIHFPKGSFDGQEDLYVCAFSYEEMKDILQPWAVPDSENQI